MAQIKQLQATFPENTVIFKEHEDTKEMYILLAGEVQVKKGDRIVATVNANGSFLGEMATLLHSPRTATVVTTKKSVFLKILPENIDTLFKVTPELGLKLSRTLAERLASVTDKLAASSSAASGANVKAKISPEELVFAEKELAKGAKLEQKADPGRTVEFLTRTEVHKEAMRLYFNLVGEERVTDDLIREMDVPEALGSLVVKEFCEAGLMKASDGKVLMVFSESLFPAAQDWIFANGLFRLAQGK